MSSLSFIGNHQFVRRLLLPSCKSGILGLWARTMADANSQNESVPHEDVTKSDVSLTMANEGVEQPLDKDIDEKASKKLKINSKEEFPIIDSGMRKKVAVILAYCGRGYYGMQWNFQKKTIEGELLSAMLKAGLITKENLEAPNMMQFQRASRTDKGVSAARQVVSLRIRSDVVNKDLVEKINVHLPPEIKVMGIQRTVVKFNSKTWCNARCYSYTLPTYAFAPVTEKTSEDYRITDDVIERLNSVLNLFKGTHNFHNFTSKRKPDDEYVNRYIMKFESGKPVVDDGLELLTIAVKGKGFMLNQIRKMIAITILVMRDWASTNLIEQAFNDGKVDIPVAPSVGLMLERADYDTYNKECAIDGSFHSLEWNDLDETIENFKRSQIRISLLIAEKHEQSMLQWLSTLPLFICAVKDQKPWLSRTKFGWAKIAIENDREAKKSVDELADRIEIKSASLTEKVDIKSVIQMKDLPTNETSRPIEQTHSTSSSGYL